MEIIVKIFEISVLVVKFISVLVLILGLVVNLKDLIKPIIYKNSKEIKNIKHNLGETVLLGLEILIIADIVETIINPTFKDIGLLASIVAIRTAISYFLNKEIERSMEIKNRKL